MKKVKTNKLPWTKAPPKKAKNQAFYNGTKWRNTSKDYRGRVLTCEVCSAKGKIRAVLQQGQRVGVLDHIITIENGGSQYDERNHIAMCSYILGSCHDKKRALESRGLFIPFKLNGAGEKIPQDREFIINVLNSE